MLSVTCYPGNIRLPELVESFHHLMVHESSGIEDNVSMLFPLPVICLWVNLWPCFNVENCISLQVIRVKKIQGIQVVFCCSRHIYFYPWRSSWFLVLYLAYRSQSITGRNWDRNWSRGLVSYICLPSPMKLVGHLSLCNGNCADRWIIASAQITLKWPATVDSDFLT